MGLYKDSDIAEAILTMILAQYGTKAAGHYLATHAPVLDATIQKHYDEIVTKWGIVPASKDAPPDPSALKLHKNYGRNCHVDKTPANWNSTLPWFVTLKRKVMEVEADSIKQRNLFLYVNRSQEYLEDIAGLAQNESDLDEEVKKCQTPVARFGPIR